MKEFILFYVIAGLLACVTMGVVGRIKGKEDFTPLYFACDFSGFGFFLGFLLWPLWITVQVIEWNTDSGHVVAQPRKDAVNTIKIGAIGVAVTNLMPGGKIRIDGKLIDAITASGTAESGQEVVVIEHTPTGVCVKLKNDT
jgi:membrane-bound ClpP family serine protease